MLAISNLFDIASIHAAGCSSARRALAELADELAIWSFEWCNIANVHEAALRAHDERS